MVGTHRLMMMFDAKDLQLRQWTVTDPQGYDTTVAVYNLDTNKKPDPSLFRNQLPGRSTAACSQAGRLPAPTPARAPDRHHLEHQFGAAAHQPGRASSSSAARPDVLCLQETKCPDDRFPRKRFSGSATPISRSTGRRAITASRSSRACRSTPSTSASFCGKTDCRHIAVTIGEQAGLARSGTLHNFYVPAGGDEPDPEINEKFAHKLAFLDEMRGCAGMHPRRPARAILVGDLNVAPLEHDVWSHKQLLKVVSPHADRMREAQRGAGSRRLDRRHARLRAGAGQALHVVELSRRRLGRRPTAAAGSTTSGSRRRSPTGCRA